MPSTRRQKAKARKSREMDMMSDFENLDVMLGNNNNNPIERELAEAIDQSSAHGDANTHTYLENEYRDYQHENDVLRQNEIRHSFETFSNEFNLRLSQEMDSMMSMMHNQINRAVTTAINERVIPEIQNIASSMSSAGHRDTEASSSPNSQENRESVSGPKIKIAKKDSRSVGDLRETLGQSSHTLALCYFFDQSFPEKNHNIGLAILEYWQKVVEVKNSRKKLRFFVFERTTQKKLQPPEFLIDGIFLRKEHQSIYLRQRHEL